jgi:5-methyltetrahydrofolate corrinoid/iron sulfur protein methyltransferase
MEKALKGGRMYIIASNISTRNSKVNTIFRQAKAGNWFDSGEANTGLQELAEQCDALGAEILEIDIQQHYDSPEAMEFAVSMVQQVTDLRLCLSSNNPRAIEIGLGVCKRPPLVNYVSIDQAKVNNSLALAAEKGAGVVLLVSDPANPSDATEMLLNAGTLVGAANDLGIPNSDIFLDPGLVHVTSDAGQRHLQEIMKFLQALPDVFEEEVQSTCWLTNCSAGAPRRLRRTIETTLLPMLAGGGLSSVFLDVLREDNRRTVRLVNVFTDHTVYSESEIEEIC